MPAVLVDGMGGGRGKRDADIRGSMDAVHTRRAARRHRHQQPLLPTTSTPTGHAVRCRIAIDLSRRYG